MEGRPAGLDRSSDVLELLLESVASVFKARISSGVFAVELAAKLCHLWSQSLQSKFSAMTNPARFASTDL
jgi:hypothetical protein